MRKIAILTIVSINFGNRLQNYALQEVIKGLGYNVYTLNREKKTIFKKIKNRLRKYIRTDRLNNFIQFNKYINWAYETVSVDYISPNLSSKYDKFIIGSDQIWNTDFDFITDMDFLPMIEKKKKVSYAASFGVSSLPTNEVKHIGSMLSDIKCISVRENSGVDIVKDSCGREAQVVLDPTLLLPVQKWINIEKRPKIKLAHKYLVKYFLGDSEKDAYIDRIALDNNLQVIDILDSNVLVGPSEFVYLIHNSEMVCTDSFHASVFSFIFEKPFIVFERVSNDKDMSSRLDTFCETFKLYKNRYNSIEFDIDKCMNIDYTEGKKILLEKQKTSMNYLKKALIK